MICVTRFSLFFSRDSLTWEKCLPLREALAKASSADQLRTVVQNIEECFQPYHSGAEVWSPPSDHSISKLPFPPWLCQPYVRLPPEEYIEKMKTISSQMKRARENGDGQEEPQEGALSKRKQKKLAKNPSKKFNAGREPLQPCSACPNPQVRI